VPLSRVTAASPTTSCTCAPQCRTTLHTLASGAGPRRHPEWATTRSGVSLFYGAALIGAVTVAGQYALQERRDRLLPQQADCKALLYVPRFLTSLSRMVKEIACPAFDIHRPLPEWSIAIRARLSPQDTLLIQFTSGTTALSQGAMLTHDNMLRDAGPPHPRPASRRGSLLQLPAFFHVPARTLSALMALVAGATLVTAADLRAAPRSR